MRGGRKGCEKIGRGKESNGREGHRDEEEGRKGGKK